jgi:hypothetical protein
MNLRNASVKHLRFRQPRLPRQLFHGVDSHCDLNCFFTVDRYLLVVGRPPATWCDNGMVNFNATISSWNG